MQQQQPVGVTKLRLTDLNTHLICVLCGGYLIDATTIVECLHSFCRSCIIKYLEGSSFCPLCDCQIHKAKPYRNLKPDKALQDIVYKLVPGLFHSEMRRRREFYAKHPEYLSDATTPEGRGEGIERLIYSPDDSISLSLEYLDPDIIRSSKGEISADCKTGHNKRYLQCPALVTISHLKKFLRYKYDLTTDHVVELIHRRESLPDDYTLMDVAYIYTWKRSSPMRFFYSIYEKGGASAVTNSLVLSSLIENKNVSLVTKCAEEEQLRHKEHFNGVTEPEPSTVESTLAEKNNESMTPASEKAGDKSPHAETSTETPDVSERLQDGEGASEVAKKAEICDSVNKSLTEVRASIKSKPSGTVTPSAKIPRLKTSHRNGSLGKKISGKVSLATPSNVKRLKGLDRRKDGRVNLPEVKDITQAEQNKSANSHSPEVQATISKGENETTSCSGDAAISPDSTVKISAISPSSSMDISHTSENILPNSAVNSVDTSTKDSLTSEIPPAESLAVSESDSCRDIAAGQSSAQENQLSLENVAMVSSSFPKDINDSQSPSKETCSSTDNSDSGILVSPSSDITENSSSVENGSDNTTWPSQSSGVESVTPSKNSTEPEQPSQSSTEEDKNKVAEASPCSQSSTASLSQRGATEPACEQSSNAEDARPAESNSSKVVSSESVTTDASSCSSQGAAASSNEASRSNVLTSDESREFSIEHNIDRKTMQVLNSECEIKNMYSTAAKPNQVPSLKATIKTTVGSTENAKNQQKNNMLCKKLGASKISKNNTKPAKIYGKSSVEHGNKVDIVKTELIKNTLQSIAVDKQNLKTSAANNTKLPVAPIKETDKAQSTKNILKNNQQILKKNDEILRTANSALPYFKTQPKLGLPYQNMSNLKRKQQTAESLQKKNCNVQPQVSEDKPSAKKRRVMISKDSATVTVNRNVNPSGPNKPLMAVISSGLPSESSNPSVEKKPSHPESHDPQSIKTHGAVTPSAQTLHLSKRGTGVASNTAQQTDQSKLGTETFKRIKTESSENGTGHAETAKNMFCVNSNGLQIIPISRSQQESAMQNQSMYTVKKSPTEAKTTVGLKTENRPFTPSGEAISVRPLNNKLYTKANTSKDKKLSSDSHIAALLSKSNSVNIVKHRNLNSVPAHVSPAFAQPSPIKAVSTKTAQKPSDGASKSPRHPSQISQSSSPRDRQDNVPPSLLGLLKQEKTSEESRGSKPSGKHDNFGALDLSASPRRAQHSTIVSIADTLARRQQLKCVSPPPLSPLSALSPFPVTSSASVRSPPPPLRIPVPGSQQRATPQQRPSSLSSSSPSPPAESPGSSRMGPPAQDLYMSPFLPLMLRQQQLQRMWSAASSAGSKPLNPSANDWYGDGSVKRLENLMKSFHQQQQHQQQQQQQQQQGQQAKVGSANVPLFPYTNNRHAK